MKYIRDKNLGIFLFPNTGGAGVIHREMLDFILDYTSEGKIISAGFVRVEDNRFICHGYSQSIGLGTLDDDSKVLNEQFSIEK